MYLALEERVNSLEESINKYILDFSKYFGEMKDEISKFKQEIQMDLVQILKEDKPIELPDQQISGPRTLAWSQKRQQLEKKYSKSESPVKVVNSQADVFEDK